jgi:MoaD family protein
MVGELKILFHANFREITKKREIFEKIEDNSTVASVLEILAKKYGKDFNEIIDPETGQISTDVIVMLNGRVIRATDTKLKDKDVFVITLPLGGG